MQTPDSREIWTTSEVASHVDTWKDGNTARTGLARMGVRPLPERSRDGQNRYYADEVRTALGARLGRGHRRPRTVEF